MSVSLCGNGERCTITCVCYGLFSEVVVLASHPLVKCLPIASSLEGDISEIKTINRVYMKFDGTTALGLINEIKTSRRQQSACHRFLRASGGWDPSRIRRPQRHQGRCFAAGADLDRCK